MSKTEQRMIKQGLTIVETNQPRMMKAMRLLEAKGLATVQKETNSFGYTYFKVRAK